MKITHLTQKEEVWPHFHNFCISSKPYDFCIRGSRSLRQRKIKEIFEEFSTREIYKAEEIDKVIEKWETWIKNIKEDINDRDKKDKKQQNTKQENIPDSKD